MRDSYAAVVFYSMLKETPSDQAPWYGGKPLTAFERLGQTRQGIILLHHALLAYPDWPVWDEIAGMKARKMRSYHPGETVRVDIPDPQHPISQGLTSWDMIDETYLLDGAVMPDSIPGNRVFLIHAQPKIHEPAGMDPAVSPGARLLFRFRPRSCHLRQSRLSAGAGQRNYLVCGRLTPPISCPDTHTSI